MFSQTKTGVRLLLYIFCPHTFLIASAAIMLGRQKKKHRTFRFVNAGDQRCEKRDSDEQRRHQNNKKEKRKILLNEMTQKKNEIKKKSA